MRIAAYVALAMALAIGVTTAVLLAVTALLAVVGARGAGRVPFAAAFGMAAVDLVVLAVGG